MDRLPTVVLDAPSNLGLRPLAPGHVPGCDRAPDALRANGLLERLGASDAGRIQASPYSTDVDAVTGVRNGEAIREYSLALAERLGSLLDGDAFPLVLGGDCSILIGSMLALRRRGRYGLVFIDGHLDFYHPGNSERARTAGSAAGMDLALVTGRGADALTNLDGLRPLVRDEDVVALGYAEWDEVSADIAQTAITLVDVEEARRVGMEDAASGALDRLRRNGVEGVWVHVDADVLHERVMPAVDSPNPEGLEFEELARLLRVLVDSEVTVGLELTIFDPDLDPDGTIAERLVACLAEAFVPPSSDGQA